MRSFLIAMLAVVGLLLSGCVQTQGPAGTATTGPTASPGVAATAAPRPSPGTASTPGPTAVVPPAGGTFASNGQRIYFTATSNSGQPITYQFEGNVPMRGPMMQLACVDCHGSDGHGGRVTMMMASVEAPNITWPALTEAENQEGQPEGHEMDHPPYTVETVKRAITQGVDPAGNQLDPYMPRWSMAPPDLDDLVNYLETLK
ncbi:MAG: c-type cytochrome [Chloroflexota bacterium]